MEAASQDRPPSELIDLARRAALRAYAPYSNFHVGAAVKLVGGRTYYGCNVENVSYGLTACAERNALWATVAQEGEFNVEEIVVYTDNSDSCSPCGACRQVIGELAPKAIVWFLLDGEFVARSCDELMPDRFGQKGV